MLYRLRDVLVAVVVLGILSGPLVLICLILLLTQQRVFFVQERTGYRGRPFRLVKFSTLRDIRPGEREEDSQRGRLTPLGKVLRRLSLDEIPNLFNVLAGQMSLVGPRPLIHDYWTLYSDAQKRRFEVLPGITGWAQVKGRNALTFTDRFVLDAWYVDHKSLGLDIKILGMTVGKLFSGQGVYVDGQTTAERFDGTN
ncbi:UNVERIFIED_CONTAM: hypothetical protein GTU68_012526 [Idotea baltica]|nr:hypothetical protein [Idotea baltica]